MACISYIVAWLINSWHPFWLQYINWFPAFRNLSLGDLSTVFNICYLFVRGFFADPWWISMQQLQSKFGHPNFVFVETDLWWELPCYVEVMAINMGLPPCKILLTMRSIHYVAASEDLQVSIFVNLWLLNCWLGMLHCLVWLFVIFTRLFLDVGFSWLNFTRYLRRKGFINSYLILHATEKKQGKIVVVTLLLLMCC